MARYSSGATARLGKRSRNVSETASLSSLGSEVNVHSDAEEVPEVPKKRRSTDSVASFDQDGLGKMYTSSDDESSQRASRQGSGRRPKCFSRNAVLARQNRLKKKKYMEDLESELQTLRKENKKLKVSLDGYSKDVELVRKENVYLRNVLASSKELSQLLRSINLNCGVPATSLNSLSGLKKPEALDKVSSTVESRGLDSCVPSSNPLRDIHPAARTAKKNFPIAADDVCLSLSAPEDDNDLDILFGSKSIPDLDLNLNEEPLDYLGFGPNSLGDWLDGEEPLSHVGVCLHVANHKVSLEFCSTCNENALSSWNGISA